MTARSETAYAARLSPRVARWNSGLTGNLAITLCYLLVAVLFNVIYYRTTLAWSEADFVACVNGSGPWPGYRELFGARVLVPSLARWLKHLTRAEYLWIFRAITTLAFFGLLTAYRAYLSNFIRPRLAAALSLAIVYPMLWNFCLLSNLYYPFDIPSVLLFTAGCHFIQRDRPGHYYVTLVLALLNREASVLLVFVYVTVLFGRTPTRRLVANALAQLAVVAVVRLSVGLAVWEGDAWIPSSNLGANLRIVTDMLTVRGNALKDWAKFVLSFGGVWLLVPWAWRGRRSAVRRFLLAVAPAAGIVFAFGVVDEMRLYGEFVPLLLTPVLCSLAERAGLTRSGKRADPSTRPRDG